MFSASASYAETWELRGACMLILRTIVRHQLSDLDTNNLVASCFASLFILLLLIAFYGSNARLVYLCLPQWPVYLPPLHPQNER